MVDHNDTIAAIATGSGAAGVGIVRVSGAHALRIADALSDRSPHPGRVAYSRFRDADGELIDDGLLLAFAAPHSYTGEEDRQSVVSGKSVSVRVDIGGRRLIKKKKTTRQRQ